MNTFFSFEIVSKKKFLLTKLVEKFFCISSIQLNDGENTQQNTEKEHTAEHPYMMKKRAKKQNYAMQSCNQFSF